MRIPEYHDIEQAHLRIEKFINRTPVMTSESLDQIFGCKLFFKFLNFQKVGAFKFRGAMNAVLMLSDEEAVNGVATHSSGNHAAALALAARRRGIPSYVVMPENAPMIKKIAVDGYGARITYCHPTLEAREETLREIVDRTRAIEIHPYNNTNVIAGQGTAVKVLIDAAQAVDDTLSPLGGRPI